jgi:hypothetical protein
VRYRVFSACAAAALVACGESSPYPAPIARSETTASVTSAHADCPVKRCIIVGSESSYNGKPFSAVLFFARNANGDVAPAGEISGAKTKLSVPAGLAMDSQGNIYVANYDNAIRVYASGAQGNVAPIRTIAGATTKLKTTTGIAIDSNDELYVSNSPNRKNGWITVYAAGANGNVAPIRKIGGSKTKLFAPWGLGFDSQANLYVANDDPNTGWITVYSPNAKGDAAPIRTIEGSATSLAGPTGLSVDASGYVYVVNSESVNWEVGIFAPGADGNQAPVSYFSGGYGAFGLTLGGHGIYVTSVGYDDEPFVATFSGGPVGNEGHILRRIQGRKTKLIWPQGIIVK